MKLASYAARAQAVVLALLLPAIAQADPYTFNYINIMTEWQYSSGGTISAINNSNQVTGYVSFGPELPGAPFLFDKHGTAYLGSQLANIHDINDAGVMAGTAPGGTAALLANGQTSTLLNDGRSSTALAINNHGVAVGYAMNTGVFSYHAMVYNNGAVTELGTLGGRDSFATDINDAGVIVGNSHTSDSNFATHAFIYKDGVMTDLGVPAGATASAALSVADDGSVLGTAYLPNGTAKGFLYHDGVTTDLSGIFTRSVADMNSTGTILGESEEGFMLYNRLGQVVDLSLVVSQTTGSTLTQVFAISDNGTVGGEICGDLGCTLALMIPSAVPEPATYGMLLIGLGVVGWLGRRGQARSYSSTMGTPTWR
ncbi:HAF repeat-containing PEP-CTERM protein [Pseudoduganella aquatica]|uniref:PEP-CTERM sorting domain-containing protein n=1 Tax=Pseudoduganella aquatica TaxID=2660641 RepID=A0A7X4KLF6_9BURK|nr:HAF repeat-containing PEP-CTERM protein [Pseudoduganella aquatica]MYN06730.1 PEP-CTERM sorting domain-containing protein [Pseudoduganella aquatica]